MPCCGADNSKNDLNPHLIVGDDSSKALSKDRLEKGVKLVLLGEMNTGKTSIVHRLVKDQFLDHVESTIGAAFMVQKLVVDDINVKLEIWDTAGQERYRSLAPMYYRGASASIVVYDITKKDSVETMKRWVEELKKQADPDIVIAIAGNKIDLEDQREIQKEEIEKFITTLYDSEDNAREKQENIIHTECSAKSGQNVEDIFISICRKLIMKSS